MDGKEQVKYPMFTVEPNKKTMIKASNDQKASIVASAKASEIVDFI